MLDFLAGGNCIPQPDLTKPVAVGLSTLAGMLGLCRVTWHSSCTVRQHRHCLLHPPPLHPGLWFHGCASVVQQLCESVGVGVGVGAARQFTELAQPLMHKRFAAVSDGRAVLFCLHRQNISSAACVWWFGVATLLHHIVVISCPPKVSVPPVAPSPVFPTPPTPRPQGRSGCLSCRRPTAQLGGGTYWVSWAGVLVTWAPVE